MEKLKRNGGGQVEIGEKRLWSNGRVILERVRQEKERREYRKSAGMHPVESRSWGAVINAATKEQIEKREMDIFEIRAAERTPARIHMGHDDEIYYMDANGESGMKSRT